MMKSTSSRATAYDENEAFALLSGDPVRGAVASLVNAAHGGLTDKGTDEHKIFRVLAGLSKEERAQVIQAYKQTTGVDLDAMLKSELSGDELATGEALLAGNVAKASAVRMKNVKNMKELGAMSRLLPNPDGLLIAAVDYDYAGLFLRMPTEDSLKARVVLSLARKLIASD